MPDGAYWYDYASGKFITSSFYTQTLPAWVNDFHTTHPFSNYMKVWDLLQPSESYTYANEDNTPYEQLIGGKTAPVFPYDFTSLPAEQ